MNTLMKIMSIGSVILTPAVVVSAQDAGRAGRQLDDRRSASIHVAALPHHEKPIDAVALAVEPLAQQSTARPRQARAAATGSSDMWSFHPERDTFRADALLDLRGLNEPIAGQSGFIRLSADKNGFVRGDGTPMRFWAVNYCADVAT